MDLQGLVIRAVQTFGESRLTKSAFWLAGIGFLATYLALNTLTGWYQFRGLGITLWSPDDGLTLLLLTEGLVFAPFVFLAEVLADVFISHVHHSLRITAMVEFVTTLGYMGLALFLREGLKFNLKRSQLRDVVTLLMAIPPGAALTSFAYCGPLYLAGSLPADEFFSAIRHYWIGDTVGIIVVIPAATALTSLLSKARWRWSTYELVSGLVFVAGTCVAFSMLIAAGTSQDYHLFYLLFLPIIWVGLRLGYIGVAIALLVTQILLFLTASYLGFTENDLDVFQLLMLVLSITGLLLGAVVTEREHASQQLREQQTELAQSSVYSTVGVAGMILAHELSQPLSTVATYLHAARRMLQTTMGNESILEALGKAEAEAQRTREVLERVREFISTGRIDLDPVDLSVVSQKIRALCIEGANSRNVDIAVESFRPIPFVRADRMGVELVLNNLVVNAIDAASEREDGKGLVIIRVAQRGVQVVIEVDDNGPGVAPEMATSLFEAYQTTKPRGMGLGLALSRQIVERHAGRLWWRPIMPEGTRFVVELSVSGAREDAS